MLRENLTVFRIKFKVLLGTTWACLLSDLFSFPHFTTDFLLFIQLLHLLLLLLRMFFFLSISWLILSICSGVCANMISERPQPKITPSGFFFFFIAFNLHIYLFIFCLTLQKVHFMRQEFCLLCCYIPRTWHIITTQ